MDQITIAIIIIAFIIIVVFLIDKYFLKSTKKSSCQQSKKKSDDARGRDPVLHYEVTKGKFGDSSRQSLSYSGKKTRWK
jgi:hypothetical protein